MRLLVAPVICLSLLKAQPTPEVVNWSRTPELLSGKRTIVSFADGTTAEGTWQSVTNEAFTMHVEKTSRKQVAPKGLGTFSRSSIVSLRVGHRRARGRIVGTLAGFYAVTATAGASTGSREALQGAWGMAAIGGGVLGYFLGRASDKATREIVIAPPLR